MLYSMRCTEKGHTEREDKEQLLNGKNLMPRGIKNQRFVWKLALISVK